MADDRKSKRYKNLFSWFTPGSILSSDSVNDSQIRSGSGPSGSRGCRDVTENSVNDVTLNSSPVGEERFDINSLQRDPGLRLPICNKYPLNERDSIRRAYVVLGPYQPISSFYPPSFDGGQGRKFNPKWFQEWPCLEYSEKLDKAFCFPCYLFDSYPSHHPAFTEHGFQGWKNVRSKQSGFTYHMGGINSQHSIAMHKWESLRNPSSHIERVISTQSSQEIADNRLRLVTAIEVTKLLALQGCAFRGHDESADSSNGGNFTAVVNSFRRMNIEVDRVFQSGPKNAKYIAPSIQKQILNILGNKVRTKIREEVGQAKFCILVDEAVDVSHKEQMAIILRFVDCHGFIRERFFNVLSVADTCSQTLKDEISKVLAQYDLQVEDIRGQGYDGASNMRGEFNGLQALFSRECPYAYYVHCFAHRLQLTLNAAAKDVHVIWDFFSILQLIVNFVDSSAKRHSALRVASKEEIAELVAAGELETGKGANQTCTLQRAGTTRWGSHLRSISSLIKLYGATRTILANLEENGQQKVQAEASSTGKAMKRFDFVFCLHLMHDVMRITDFLCQSLQKKAIDILNALSFLKLTKSKLQKMRENGWEDLIMRVESFCEEYAIIMPDMSAPYKKGTRACEQNITNEHYYRVNILNVVIDFQLAELDTRFTDNSLEHLILSATFDPHDNFRSFKSEDVYKLASKFYPTNFTSYDVLNLEMECEYFVADILNDQRFANTSSLSDLCRRLVESRKSAFFPMIYKLICLVLTLPVSTATTERAFSSMSIIKSKLRNKMEDEFLDDSMVLYIEREYAESIDNDSVISEFEVSGPRRVQFR